MRRRRRRRRRYCFPGVFRSLTWPATTIAIGASFVSIGSLSSSCRCLLRSFREHAFWRRFSFLFFPVAVEASAWSSLWRFPCLATAWFFWVYGSVIFHLCRKHIQSFCSCFCTTAVTVLDSEGESFLYRGKKDLSGDQNHVECPGYVTRRHD